MCLNICPPAFKQRVNLKASSTEHDDMTTIATITATPDLEIVEGHITTTSNQVAEHFGKAHRSVLLAIRRLECSEEFRLHNFVQSSYINEQGKEQPRYRLTRDGFVFL